MYVLSVFFGIQFQIRKKGIFISQKGEYIYRYSIFLLGITINALGIAFITKSNLGTPPITSIAYVPTFIFPLSLGLCTFITNMLMIIAQILILRKKFPKMQYLQIVMTIIFSFFIDFFQYILIPMQPHSYIIQMIILLSGCMDAKRTRS